MANKKSNKKKNKKNTSTNNKKVIEKSYNSETKKVLMPIIIVIIILVLVYLLTLFITKNSTDSVVKDTVDNTTIQYSEILAGTSFKQTDEEYLVLFYDVDNDTDSSIYSLRSDYEAKDEHLPIYYVDLGNKLNNSCVSEDENPNAENATELKINQPTLIKFVNGKISEYMTGDEIESFLSE